MANGSVIVVGGTRAIGLEPRHYVQVGATSSLTAATANIVSAVKAGRRAVARLPLRPRRARNVAPALADVGPVRRLALVAIERDQNSVADYDLAQAIRLVTLKLVGYRGRASAARPAHRRRVDPVVRRDGQGAAYPGSTTVTTVNGGVVGLTRTLVEELSRAA